MAENQTQRKLTAILSADVKGYSRLMGDDDESTVSTITAYRQIVAELIEKHQGRVVDTPGDNILAEFGSTLNAVSGAIEIQHRLGTENGNLPDHRRMDFRIGINLGDIIHKDDRIYGDGVNVAARIESLADPGGICISRGVYDQVKTKVRQGFEYQGEHAVKNISNPVRIYKVLTKPEYAGKVIGEKRFLGRFSRKVAITAILALAIATGALITYYFYLHQSGRIEPAMIEKMAFPLPNKPSIAVLPFENLSEDPAKDQTVVDGITANIITLLSKVPRLFVISRNSTFAYKGKPVKVQKVAEELGVQYVLEGSVQRSGDQVRITAQLVDALGGHQIWSERFDRQFKNVFAIQDEIGLNVVSALRVLLREGEQARVVRGGTRSVEAWELYLQADVQYKLWSKESEAKARDLVQQALVLDPNFVDAWIMLATTHIVDARFGYGDSREDSLRAAEEAVARALSVDDTNSSAYGVLRAIYLWKGEHDKSIAMGEKGLTLNPNDSNTIAGLAWVMFCSGRPEEALELIRRAMRLNPTYPDWWLMVLEEAYRLSGRYDEAIETIQEELRRLDHYFTRTRLALYYAQTGQDEQARTEIERVLRAKPDMNLEIWANSQFFKDSAKLERDLADLRRVGLPEKPKIPQPPDKQN